MYIRQRDFGIFYYKTNHISASEVRRGRDLYFWKEIVSGRTACLDRGPRVGHLAPASEVAGGFTIPF
jgi:hypothetical protein